MIRTMLTDKERLERAKRIRVLSIKTLGYYLLVLVPALLLGVFQWLGEKADDAWAWMSTPAYRWRSEQEELRREIIRDNRRRAGL